MHLRFTQEGFQFKLEVNVWGLDIKARKKNS